MMNAEFDTREYNLVVQLLAAFVKQMQPMPVYLNSPDTYAYPLAAQVANSALQKLNATEVPLVWKDK